MERQLDTSTLLLLGGIALLSVLQGLLLLGAAWSAFRAVRRTEQMATRMGGALGPAARELTRAAHDTAEISDLVVAQAHRLDVLVTEVVDRVERTQRAAQRLLPVAARVAAAASVLKLLRSGVRAVRSLRR
jgi:hypothetical protein